jgi:hypothetical protein
MAQSFVQIALQTAPPLIQKSDVIYKNVKEKVKNTIQGRRKSRTRNDQEYQSDVEYNNSSRSRNMDRSRGRDQGPYTAPLPYSDPYYRPRQGSVEDISRAFPPPGIAYGTQNPDPRSGRRKSDLQPINWGCGLDCSAHIHTNLPLGTQRYKPSSDSESSPPPKQNDRRRRNTVVGEAAVGGAAAGVGYGAAQQYYGGGNYPVANYQRPRSEGRDQANGGDGREKNKTTEKDNGKGKNRKNDSDSGSDSSSDSDGDSSSLPSSSEDEREHKHIRAKEFITAGLAAVATVHAAAGVYNSLEASHKRAAQVNSGKLSAEDARKEKNKALLQDAAALGVAALSIKGAMAKWHGAHEHHKKRKEHKQAKKERHYKREQRRSEKASTAGGDKSLDGKSPGAVAPYPVQYPNNRPVYNRSYSRSEPDLSRVPYNGTPGKYTPGRYVPQGYYQDGNPYGVNGRR